MPSDTCSSSLNNSDTLLKNLGSTAQNVKILLGNNVVVLGVPDAPVPNPLLQDVMKSKIGRCLLVNSLTIGLRFSLKLLEVKLYVDVSV